MTILVFKLPIYFLTCFGLSSVHATCSDIHFSLFLNFVLYDFQWHFGLNSKLLNQLIGYPSCIYNGVLVLPTTHMFWLHRYYLKCLFIRDLPPIDSVFALLILTHDNRHSSVIFLEPNFLVPLYIILFNSFPKCLYVWESHFELQNWVNHVNLVKFWSFFRCHSIFLITIEW
jgi:hypothetical protein